LVAAARVCSIRTVLLLFTRHCKAMPGAPRRKPSPERLREYGFRVYGGARFKSLDLDDSRREEYLEGQERTWKIGRVFNTGTGDHRAGRRPGRSPHSRADTTVRDAQTERSSRFTLPVASPIASTCTPSLSSSVRCRFASGVSSAYFRCLPPDS